MRSGVIFVAHWQDRQGMDRLVRQSAREADRYGEASDWLTQLTKEGKWSKRKQ
jgi:hypothetical protein